MPIPASWSKKKAEAAKKDAIRPTTKPDLDNILKMMDALNGVAWKDDAQVVSVLIQKYYSEAAGMSVYITWEDDK